MPDLPVEFHPAAADEVTAAKDWYGARSSVAADAFGQEVDRAIASVAEAPQRWSEHTHGTRRFLLRRFPFAIVYHVDESRITILAVAHARRLPGYWQER